MEIILYFITSTITLLIGYFLGANKPTKPQDILDMIKTEPKQDDKQVGVIKRLNEQEKRYNKSIQKEGDDAMSDTLDLLLDND